MGDFSYAPLFVRKSILLEAPGDENNNQGGGNQSTPDQNRPTSTAQNTDFNIDTSDTPALGNDNDDTPNTQGDTNQNSQGQQDDNTGEAEAQASVETLEKQKDREIFDSLSPQEQMIKTYKLKELFMELYSRCDNLIKKYDTLGIEFEEYSTIIKKTLDTLYDLKDMINTYYHDLFDFKSYYDNDIMFNRYLLVLDTIRLTTEEMVKQHKEDIEAAKAPIFKGKVD